MIACLRENDSSTGMRRARSHTPVVFLAMLVVTLACRHEPKVAQAQDHVSLRVESASFTGAIPQRFTCDGAGVSPALAWSLPPSGTKSLAIVMHDPDAPVDFTAHQKS